MIITIAQGNFEIRASHWLKSDIIVHLNTFMSAAHSKLVIIFRYLSKKTFDMEIFFDDKNLVTKLTGSKISVKSLICWLSEDWFFINIKTNNTSKIF